MARCRSRGVARFCLAHFGALLACGELTENVSTDVCLSGIRWVGKNSSDEEMSPGTDCVGCHLSTDGPPLSAAGTVYASVDNTSQIENDCFGLEGVEVEIEAANGTVLLREPERTPKGTRESEDPIGAMTPGNEWQRSRASKGGPC